MGFKKRLAILASGAGSNAHNILTYFSGSSNIEVVLIASNKPNAGVMSIAQIFGVDTFILTRDNFSEPGVFSERLKEKQVDYIILAGFLWRIPLYLVHEYDRRIINIHPALLPGYGGKGMYGHYVHQAVHEAGERESGITIHYVDDQYDEGDIIFQARVPIDPNDTPQDIERKVRELEMKNYPEVIERWISGSASHVEE
jgi:phosphoribosylglycinamide formyltransferase 1